MSLQVQNDIFDPTKPLLLMADTSALETSLVVFQWCAQTLALQIFHTKSILLTRSLRRQSPVHRETFGVSALLQLAKPYLFQSTVKTNSKTNLLFSDAKTILQIVNNWL